ncbi:uncharacterized protein LOC123314413 isoform X2 [Coccinella septempunctata]|uniref:uncharacterized protein LOC123314413 isoform X2 n=1 Tax=Coccinella septempunctata TaxID=41139 RepID=UPI001D06AA76|nr:uncharacterized protein LOC123314413 isoform X2 [Coccinella septempunctata]
MDPVLQRFGDVTIQRVEKPRPPPPPSAPQFHEASILKTKDKSEDEEEEYYTSLEEDSFDEEEEAINLKRPLERTFPVEQELPVKKSKQSPVHSRLNLGTAIPSGITIDKILEKKPPDVSNSFSDDEIPSEFGTDSEMDSDEDLSIPDHVQEKTSIKEEEEEEANDSSFLDKLVDGPFMEPCSSKTPVCTQNKAAESVPSETEDYDYDIKEKLKEMGEISFETVKKGEKPKKVEVKVENEVVVTPAKKPGENDEIDRKTLAASNLRRNIREVMDETKLDEATLAAQRLEMERLQRVQEQQKLLREFQKQAAQERMQNKVISLLQGNNFSRPGPSTARIGSTVLVKLPNGQTKSMTRLPKRPLELMRVPKNIGPTSMPAPRAGKSILSMKRPASHLTPSVSIAPVPGSRKLPIPMSKPSHSDSESEGEEFGGLYSRKRGKEGQPSSNTTTIDISSDDDCIVVSEPEGEGPEEEDEDPTNSGMHTNDEFNTPDAEGRVLINVGHPENDQDIFLAPQIARIIKPHQIGGVRFLYDNVIESTSRFDSSPGFGCILAHSMGLGKTLQIVCFSDIFLRHTSAKTILCIMPINTLQNWMAEYNMWVPTEENVNSSPLLSHGEVRPRNFNLHVLNDSHKTLTARSKVINAWRAHGGVLLMGYEQFRLLSLKKNPKTRRKNMEPQDDTKNKVMFDAVHQALIDPGPDLVICDEGHRIKNSHASISQALKQMKTKRRIVLTGYPLQNNLMEYWCMVDFARPNYLGSKTEFCNMFERPIMNGQCIDSTEADIKLMRYRAHVLHSLLVGFVQRRSHRVLQTALPQKEEYVLLVRMTNFQRNLYETFMNEVVRIQSVPNPLKAFAVCCKIWNHPDVLYNFLKKRAEGCARDIDLEEVASVASTPSDATAPPTPKEKKTPASKGKKSSPRGRPPGSGNKPAASITPYSSAGEGQNNVSLTNSNQNTSTSTNSNSVPSTTNQGQKNFAPPPPFFEQSNAQFPPNFQSKSQQFPANFQNNAYPEDARGSHFNENTNCSFDMSQNPTHISTESNNFMEATSQDSNQTDTRSYLDISNQKGKPVEIFAQGNQFPQNFGNLDVNSQGFNFNQADFQNNQQGFQNNQNFQGVQQNFGQQGWSQNEQNEFFNSSFGGLNFNSNSNSNSSWMKKEDKSGILNSPVKSELSNDAKPKINIISDIKLPCMFNANLNLNSNSMDKKIKIISDIKIEPKKEEEGDIKDVKVDIKDVLPTTVTSALSQSLPTTIKEEVKKEKDEVKLLPPESPVAKSNINSFLNFKDKEDCGIPYDWALELLKDYIPGQIENSAKMEILFCIIKESISLGDRLLVFSQSLITLDLIEQFLQATVVPGDSVHWCKNSSYYRLDGSTSALEREKLINEFNSNPKIHLFLVSTRAGSLGINLVGANRVVVLDASWNPCHDTQAVCRVYRYGQRKPCFVYRLVVDNCLEKKIYDRQINKQGMSDRVVDECNPDAHLTIKDVSTLCWDNKYDEGEEKDWSHVRDNYIDVVLQKVLEKHGRRLNCEPFQHESLLVDRKEKQLSQQEKRLAKKSYEREKLASRQPTYSAGAMARGHRPVASVRPMQQGSDRPSRWIPAEHWQRQGMTAQEMTLPLDVVIPTNQPERGSIVLKAGQKVLVLKSPKGVYMQLESGKIVAIKTAIKVKGKPEDNGDPTKKPPLLPPSIKISPAPSAAPQKKVVKPFTPGVAKMNIKSVKQTVPNLVSSIQSVTKKAQMMKTRPYKIGSEIAKSLIQNQKEEALPSSSDEEHMPGTKEKFHQRKEEAKSKNEELDEIEKHISMLKSQISIKRTSVPAPASAPKAEQKKMNQSVLEKLERTTSLALTDNLPFQDSLESITNNSFKDDNMDDEAESASSSTDMNKQVPSDVSDHSDEVTYISEQPPQYPLQNQQQATVEPKIEQTQQDYPYNYYNYQPYPPPQGYTYPQPQPYEMIGGYPAQQPPPQPQYNYTYQGYPPPPQQYHAPPPQPPNYEYNAPPVPPPQPIYPPYNPYPQQYPPPVPPHQGIYAPAQIPPAAPSYPDYQYQQMGNPQSQTQTNQTSLPATSNQAPQTYYPNS